MLGRWLQMADLGEGTFAWVEQAELQQRGRPPRVVAVKRLRTALIEGDQELLDFIREGALLNRLRHPCAPDGVQPVSQFLPGSMCQRRGRPLTAAERHKRASTPSEPALRLAMPT